ncbi:alpha-hydroxy acid oxidase [Intrasporangium sp.]|uniref:alpha-hydroxy acid oxidase n=1 Tax=Intrasporangium sp. TaxID=1925024 RepID=UPI0032218577
MTAHPSTDGAYPSPPAVVQNAGRAKSSANPNSHRQLPKPAELRPLLQFRRPTVSPTRRRLQRATQITELRQSARRVTPRAIFDYVDGSADEEVTIGRLREEYRAIRFRPRALRDVSHVDPSTDILGYRSSLPLVFAPTGYTRMMHHEGEVAVGRAAARLGIPYGLSTVATTSPEDLRAACPDTELWFQLYLWTDRAESRRLVQRARDAGFSTLVLTVDTAIAGNRLRDERNGLTIPPALTLRTFADMTLHPSWWFNKLTTPAMRFACAPESWGSEQLDMSGDMFDAAVTADDIGWLRDLWPGHLLVKGIQTVEDAEEVVRLGADGVVLSNHGGRQLDRAQSALSILPDVVASCGDRADIFIDSGILRGGDIVAAVALGARAALVGRAYLYGLMAGGESGVQRAGEILAREVRTTMALLGATSVAGLQADMVRLPGHDPR